MPLVISYQLKKIGIKPQVVYIMKYGWAFVGYGILLCWNNLARHISERIRSKFRGGSETSKPIGKKMVHPVRAERPSGRNRTVSGKNTAGSRQLSRKDTHAVDQKDGDYQGEFIMNPRLVNNMDKGRLSHSGHPVLHAEMWTPYQEELGGHSRLGNVN